MMIERSALRRLLEDKLRAAMMAHRGGDPCLPAGPWPDDLQITGAENGLGADSLELMWLAGAVNEMFHVHEVGIEDYFLVRRRFGDWIDLVTSALETNITFQTSGSSGPPKTCLHTLVNLVAEAEEHCHRLKPKRVLLAVPSHHIYGFIFGILVPTLAQCPVIDLRSRTPLQTMFAPGDVLISYPDHWQFLQRSGCRLTDVTGVTSTAPMPDKLATALCDIGLAELIQIYGSTETAGIGWRNAPSEPYELLSQWIDASLPAEEGLAVLIGRDGRTAETPDRIIACGHRSFRVIGRSDGAVQVGGMNVFPDRVARHLESHPWIAAARVRKSSPDLGGRLKALLVLRNPDLKGAELIKSLTDWIERTLPAEQRPRSITFSDQIPTTELAKERDWTEQYP